MEDLFCFAIRSHSLRELPQSIRNGTSSIKTLLSRNPVKKRRGLGKCRVGPHALNRGTLSWCSILQRHTKVNGTLEIFDSPRSLKAQDFGMWCKPSTTNAYLTRIYIYIYIYLYLYLFIYLFVCLFVCLFLHFYAYVHLYMYMYGGISTARFARYKNRSSDWSN